jgi:pimeloyl-ACP methyl ester carboxylesterase
VSAIELSLNTLHPEVNPETHRERAEVLSQVDSDALMITLDNQHLVGLNLDTLLKQAECPTLLIQGNPELGAALFHEDMNRALTLLRYGASLSIPDGGHMLQQSHPEAIANAITDFCDQSMYS